MAKPICFRLLLQLMRAAASRTFCTAGSSRPMSTAMMAITTSSSIRVNAGRNGRRTMERSPHNEGGKKVGLASLEKTSKLLGTRHEFLLDRSKAGKNDLLR